MYIIVHNGKEMIQFDNEECSTFEEPTTRMSEGVLKVWQKRLGVHKPKMFENQGSRSPHF